MPLCGGRACGCAITSTTLSVTGSGTGVDPWHVELALAGTVLNEYTYADATARGIALPSPADGQPAWLRNTNELTYWDGTTWIVAYGPAVPWINATLANGWVNYFAGFQTAQYRKIGDRVEMRGVINGTAATNTFPLLLPAGYRPPLAIQTNVRTAESFPTYMQIDSGGGVALYSYAGGSLAGEAGVAYLFSFSTAA